MVKDKAGKDVSIQQFLQDAYLNMWDMVARAVGDLEGVIGFQVCFLSVIPDYYRCANVYTDDERNSSRIYQPPISSFL